MTQEISGSDKLKEKCQTIASLTPAEINQIAGGAFGSSQYYPAWLIRGTPVIWWYSNQAQNPAQIPGNMLDQGGFGL